MRLGGVAHVGLTLQNLDHVSGVTAGPVVVAHAGAAELEQLAHRRDRVVHDQKHRADLGRAGHHTVGGHRERPDRDQAGQPPEPSHLPHMRARQPQQRVPGALGALGEALLLVAFAGEALDRHHVGDGVGQVAGLGALGGGVLGADAPHRVRDQRRDDDVDH